MTVHLLAGLAGAEELGFQGARVRALGLGLRAIWGLGFTWRVGRLRGMYPYTSYSNPKP